MENAFIGSDAVRGRELTRHRLRSRYQAIYPNVYVPEFGETSAAVRAHAAWLWSGRRGVVAGLAAAALLGAKWVDDEVPVELIYRNQHAPEGVITRNERLARDEVTMVNGLPVTTPARTAFDLGRHLPRDQAVARLDALANATAVAASNVDPLIARYRGARGLKRLRVALDLMDAGAQSPKETWLRLRLIEAGLPRPSTQVVVQNGDHYPLAYLDLGWEEFRVGAEYDGEDHRTNRRTYVKDRSRRTMIADLGWQIVYVLAEDHPMDVVDRIRRALWSRGYRDTYTRAKTRR